MDELIDLFFKQCETGCVQVGEFIYNIHFRINRNLNDNVLVISVNDKEVFYNYIKDFIGCGSSTACVHVLQKCYGSDRIR